MVLDAAAPATFASAAVFRQYLVELAVARWRDVLGTSFPIDQYVLLGGGAAPAIKSGPAAALVDTAPVSHSDTNTQIQGVDEGDLVETDGSFLYVLSNGSLQIVDVRNPTAPRVASNTVLDDWPIAEYLNGNRLTVIASVNNYTIYPVVDTGGVRPMAAIATSPAQGRPAVGSMMPISFYKPQVRVIEYDVSDPSRPKVARDTTLDGAYADSRAIGDSLYLVLNNYLDLPGPAISYAKGQGTYESEAQYRTRLESIDLATLLPQAVSTAGAIKQTSPLVSPTLIYKPVANGDQSLTTIAVFDVSSQAPGLAGSVGIITSDASTVLATPDHIYLASTRWPAWQSDTSNNAGPTTLIQKLSLQGETIEMSAAGTVPGQLLNQFAMDERGDYLRVATTAERFDDQGMHVSNSIYVITERDGKLARVGAIEGLSPTERLFAARFEGDRAYLETFLQVDPLLVIDLSDPTAPRLAGELHVNGFSRYLQAIDANHLIGIGRDADPKTGRPLGLQVSLFDVSDPSHPTRTATFTINPGTWAWSDAESDHHAVSYFPETRTLVIPAQGFAVANQATGQAQYRSGFWVLQVDPARGFTHVGTVMHDSAVMRSVRVGDELVTVAQNDVKIARLDAPGATLGRVVLHTQDDPRAWESGPVIYLVSPLMGSVPKTKTSAAKQTPKQKSAAAHPKKDSPKTRKKIKKPITASKPTVAVPKGPVTNRARQGKGSSR